MCLTDQNPYIKAPLHHCTPGCRSFLLSCFLREKNGENFKVGGIVNGNLKCSDYLLPWLLAFFFTNRLMHLNVLNPLAWWLNFTGFLLLQLLLNYFLLLLYKLCHPSCLNCFCPTETEKTLKLNLSDCLTYLSVTKAYFKKRI